MDSVIQKEMYNIFCSFATIFKHLEGSLKESKAIEVPETKVVNKAEVTSQSFAKTFRLESSEDFNIRPKRVQNAERNYTNRSISWRNLTKEFKAIIAKTANGGKVVFKSNFTPEEYRSLQSRIGTLAHFAFNHELRKRWGTFSRTNEAGEKELILYVKPDNSGEKFYEEVKFVDRSALIELP